MSVSESRQVEPMPMKLWNHGGLKGRIIHVAAWTIGSYAAEAALRLLSSVIMTRILYPEAFGLMAVASTLPIAVAMLSEVGIRSSIIRKAGDLEDDFLHTAWTLQVIRGIGIWIIVVACSALLKLPAVRESLPAESPLADPQMALLLSLTSSTLAIAGFQSINFFVMDRKLDARATTLCTLVSRVVSIPVMVLFAWVYDSVFALALGAVVMQVVMTALSHIIIPGIPMKFHWDRMIAGPIMSDGKWVAMSSASSVVTTLGDRFILSVLMTSVQLGWYSIALLLLEAIRSLLLRVQRKLTLAVLSALSGQERNIALRNFYRFRQPIDLAAFGASGALFTGAPYLVHVLYGSRYAESGHILSIISLNLLSLPYLFIMDMFFQNKRVRLLGVFSAVGTLSFIICLFAGSYFWGWMGAVWGVALFRWPQVIVANVAAYRLGWIAVWKEVMMLPVFGVGMLAGWSPKLLGF